MRSGSLISAPLSTGGDSQSSTTLSGTAYTVRSGVTPTAYAKLQAIQVTVSWRPVSNNNGSSNDNAMAPGSGQLVISTRVACVPVFVSSTSP